MIQTCHSENDHILLQPTCNSPIFSCRLFVAPVESDIPKRAEKNPADPAHARSAIRRRPRAPNHASEQIRIIHEEQRRLRLLAGLRHRNEIAQPPPASALPRSTDLIVDDDSDGIDGGPSS